MLDFNKAIGKHMWKFKLYSWLLSLIRNRDNSKWLAEKEKCTSPIILSNHYKESGYTWSNTKDLIVDNWQRPDQFFNEGDCDDFAKKSYTILTYHGYECELWFIYTKNEGHAIVIVNDGGTWGLMSNMEYFIGFNNKQECIDWFFTRDRKKIVKRKRVL